MEQTGVAAFPASPGQRHVSGPRIARPLGFFDHADGFGAVEPEMEPQLERAEPAAERNSPVLVLDDVAVEREA